MPSDPLKFSKRDYAIIEASKEGLSPADIHERVGGSKAYVSLTLHRARNAGLLPRVDKSYRGDPQVRVPHAVAMQFALEARARRRKNPDALIREVLKIVAQDNLFSAILDK